MGAQPKQEFQRKMKERHLVMLSLGGVIGTGLFLSSGYTIQQAGPFGTILSYLVGAVVVYLVMLCLGELSVHMPETGAFHAYAAKYALFSSIIAPDTVYIVLVSISGLAVVIVWMSISLSQLFFRRCYIREGNSVEDLAYKTPLYPFVPIASFLLCLASCIGIAFDPTQRIALYCGLPFIILCYIVYYTTQHFKKKKEPIEYASGEKRSS
ncbi:hypothetical protein RYX51_21580 [Priestia filamentosa]|nr:hypothetical protein RYX51_21580 [Priestia filamentosa]